VYFNTPLFINFGMHVLFLIFKTVHANVDFSVVYSNYADELSFGQFFYNNGNLDSLVIELNTVSSCYD